MAAHLGCCIIVLHHFSCHSLKDKRFIIRSIKDRLRHRFNISIAEVGDHQLWQKSTLAVAVVSGDRRQLDSTLDKIISFIQADGRVEIIDILREYY